ncbi:MAG: hypothetical protein GWN58_58500 [Anaerolineae bacterium]|nr:hypothetical protein [Anaerolineae bacterium]
MAFSYNADLTGADCRKTNFCHANLWAADLEEANLQGAELREANSEGARMPDGQTCGEQASRE